MAQGAGTDGFIYLGSFHPQQDAQDIRALVAGGINVAMGIGGESSSTRLMNTANADVMFNNISSLKTNTGLMVSILTLKTLAFGHLRQWHI